MSKFYNKYGVYTEKNQYGMPIYTGLTNEVYDIVSSLAYKGLTKKEISALLDISKNDFHEIDEKFDYSLTKAYHRGKAKNTEDTVGVIQSIAHNNSNQSLDAAKYVFSEICRPKKQKRSNDEAKAMIDIESLKKLVSDNTEDIKNKNISIQDY